MPKRNLGSCTVVAIDPGTTSGLVVVSIDPRWLKGQGSATWEGLGAAQRGRTAFQVGRYPKLWAADDTRAVSMPSSQLDEFIMPVLAEGQPLVEDPDEFDGRGRRAEHVYAILAGEQSDEVGRADLSYVDGSEILQVRQVQGLLDNFAEAAVVIEDFQLRTQNKKREALSPARLRLAFQVEEILHGVGRVAFLQQPSDALPTATDDRLKRAGLWFAGMEHACDAARHAAYFLRRCRTDEELRSQAFPRHFNASWS